MMTSAVTRSRSTLRERTAHWSIGVLERIGHLWLENPVNLVRFLFRLLGAWRCVFSDLSPRQVTRTLLRFLRQTSRTFFRGVFVVLALGIAIGFGTGAVARAAGPALQPMFASTVMIALLRDVAPLFLTLFLAGRVGGSIAARLGSGLGLRGPRPSRVSNQDLTWQVLPHLVAATITSAAFYVLGAWIIVKGYVSLGQPDRFLDASSSWYLSLGSTWSALQLGLVKSVAFGVMVAYVASAYGVAARERAFTGIRRVEDVQNAVWETNVTAVLIATAVSVVLWLLVEEPLR
jgi:ABC-type transporter Mla maintaining outer membrane lipid asymmetry permease subunit MlaE